MPPSERSPTGWEVKVWRAEFNEFAVCVPGWDDMGERKTTAHIMDRAALEALRAQIDVVLATIQEVPADG